MTILAPTGSSVLVGGCYGTCRSTTNHESQGNQFRTGERQNIYYWPDITQRRWWK
jgi:hypothetical protein